jgi:hypothetical protein
MVKDSAKVCTDRKVNIVQKEWEIIKGKKRIYVEQIIKTKVTIFTDD